MAEVRVLITRPREDAEPLAERLAAGGVDSLIEPLLGIDCLEGPPVDLSGVQALLVTSANGVRAFVHRNKTGKGPEDERDREIRRLPVYAVGDASACAAGEAGFETVISANGGVEDLARLVVSRLDPQGGALVHVAGSRLAGDLAGAVEKAGFAYRREVLYGARAAAELSPPAVQAIQRRTVDGVMLFSPRTAETFVQLVAKAGLEKECGGLTAWCLSRAVADKAAELKWRHLSVAANPRQEDLLEQVFAGNR